MFGILLLYRASSSTACPSRARDSRGSIKAEKKIMVNRIKPNEEFGNGQFIWEFLLTTRLNALLHIFFHTF